MKAALRRRGWTSRSRPPTRPSDGWSTPKGTFAPGGACHPKTRRWAGIGGEPRPRAAFWGGLACCEGADLRDRPGRRPRHALLRAEPRELEALEHGHRSLAHGGIPDDNGARDRTQRGRDNFNPAAVGPLRSCRALDPITVLQAMP